jgi:hypothetical protein
MLDKDFGFQRSRWNTGYAVHTLGKRDGLFLYITNERGIKFYHNLHYLSVLRTIMTTIIHDLILDSLYSVAAWDGSTRKHSISGTFALTEFVLSR